MNGSFRLDLVAALLWNTQVSAERICQLEQNAMKKLKTSVVLAA